MTGEDDRERALRAQLRDWGADMTSCALEVDGDPDAVYRHLDLPAMRFLARCAVPPEYVEPTRIGRHRFDVTTAAERVVVMEELARADVGLLLGAPGAVLAGACVSAVGDRDQRDRFFGALTGDPVWTCLALTEPEHGSDATGMRTELVQTADGAVLTGHKRYIGNGARAGLAVVFARTGPGPLGLAAALVPTSDAGYRATPLQTLGLRGVQLSEIELDQVPVPEENLLGRHLPRSRRGQWAFTRTFNQWRPGVAAISLGIAGAALAYAGEHRARPDPDQRHELDTLGRRLVHARSLVRRVAQAVDERVGDGHLASVAKLRTGRLAEEATAAACRALGPGARLEHPMLDKLARDARGIEFLEGTTHMQKLAVSQAVVTRKLDGDDPFSPDDGLSHAAAGPTTGGGVP